jgi:membrane protein
MTGPSDWFDAASLKAWSRYYARGLYREISDKNLFLWAQAIAFKVLVTIVPIVVLATGVAGRVLRGNDAFATVARFIHDFLPPSQSNQLVTFLQELQQASGTIVGLGGLGLFLSAVSLFITLRVAVSNAFEQDWHEGRSLLGGYLFDVRMVLQVGLFFILTIGFSVVAQSLMNVAVFETIGLSAEWIREGWSRAIRTLNLFVPFFITTAMFFQLYYLVPKPHPRRRSALSGALIAGALWEAAKQAFTYYATYVGHFDRYGASGEGLNALGNTFGLIIAFVFWVYFSGAVLMLGAVVASLREHRHVAAGRLPGDPPESPTPGDGTSQSDDGSTSAAPEDLPPESSPPEDLPPTRERSDPPHPEPSSQTR